MSSSQGENRICDNPRKEANGAGECAQCVCPVSSTKVVSQKVASMNSALGDYTLSLEDEVTEPGAAYSDAYLRLCLVGYSMSFIVFGSQVSILGPTLSALAAHLKVDEAALSPLFWALGLSCVASGAPSGWLAERMPCHFVLLGSLIVEAVGFLFLPTMSTLTSLTALFFVISASYNFTNSAVFTCLSRQRPGHAGPSINLVLAMFGVGSFCVPVAAEAISSATGSALGVFRLVGGFSLISAIPFIFLPSPMRPTRGETCSHAHGAEGRGESESTKLGCTGAVSRQQSSDNERLPTETANDMNGSGSAPGPNSALFQHPRQEPLVISATPPRVGSTEDLGSDSLLLNIGCGLCPAEVHCKCSPKDLTANADVASDAYVAEAASHTAASTASADALSSELRLRKILEVLVTVACTMLVFLSMASETALGNWLFTYATAAADLPQQRAAAINSAFWGCFTAGRIIAAFASRRLSPGTLLLAGTPTPVLGCLLPLLQRRPGSYATVLAAASLAGLGNSVGYANAVGLLESLVEGGASGVMNGVFGAVSGVACIAGPNAVAVLARRSHDKGGRRYEAMLYVGLFLYSLQVPFICIALAAGQRLKASRARAAAAGAGNDYCGDARAFRMPPGDRGSPVNRSGLPASATALAALAEPSLTERLIEPPEDDGDQAV